jgi:predicted GNAT family acetyltransferase
MELARYDESIALAELEESKAAERVRELKYERTRFCMQWLELIAKAQQAAQGPAVAPESEAIFGDL